jgi:hypothetical protein
LEATANLTDAASNMFGGDMKQNVAGATANTIANIAGKYGGV